jgi:HSP20 family protein
MAFAGLVPWRRDPLESIRHDFDRMFDRMIDRFDRFLGEGVKGREGWSPDFSLCETDKEYLILFELPGVEDKEVKIDATSHALTVKGERKYEPELKGMRYLYHSPNEGMFERTVSLPTTIDPDKTRARYRKGLLEIVLPKVESTVSKSIPIESAEKR